MAGNNPTAARRSSYAEKLKDPRWQKKRLEVLQRDEWACRECAATDKTLHVHHLIYWQGHEPWDYDDVFLKTLCADCHEETAQWPFHREAEALIADILACGGENAVNELHEVFWKFRGEVEAGVDMEEVVSAIAFTLLDPVHVREIVENYRGWRAARIRRVAPAEAS